MDVHKLKIATATEQTNYLEKENANLNVKLCSRTNDLMESNKTIEHLQVIIQELSCHVPIIQKQLLDVQ
jgi:hypothetical protein